jgi:basic amino acid/polyamine antiporter, APA family
MANETGDAQPKIRQPSVKTMGFWGCWALSVGTMIGSGIFLLPAVLAPYGLLSFGGWLITGLGSVAIALAIGRLARHATRSGGPYVYAMDAFGSLTGFFVGWTYWVGCWLATPAVAIAFVGYLTVLAPGLNGQPVYQAMVALALIWSLTLLSIRGVKEAGVFQIVMTLLKLAPLAAIVCLAAFSGHADRLPPVNPSGGSPLSVLSTTALLTMWAFIGIECGAIPAGNVKDPTRTIPRAVVIGTLTVAAVYIASTAAVMLLVPADLLRTSVSPFADAARGLGSWGPILVALGAIVSTTGSMNGNIFVTGQTSMAVALDGLAPKSLAWLNKGEAPWVSLILQGVLSSILLMTNYSRGLVGAFTFLLMMGTIATLIPYLVIALAELKRSWKDAKSWAMVGLFGAIYSVFAIIGSGLEVMLWGAALTAAGLPVYWLMKRRKPAVAIA